MYTYISLNHNGRVKFYFLLAKKLKLQKQET